MDAETKKLQANIYKLYFYYFFHNLIFAYVIERLFALERGLTVQQMVYLEIIYATIVIGLEVPFGAVADRWSRKNIVIICSIFYFFEFFVLIFAHRFSVFVLSVVCAAFGGALASGTINALFYDSLKALGKQEQFERVLAINRIFDYSAGSLAALSGAVMASKFGLTFNYWLSLIGVGMALLISFSLYEPSIKSSSGEADIQYWEHIGQAFRFVRKRKTLQFVILYGAFITALWIYVDEYWQIYFSAIHVPVTWFGVLSVFGLMASGLGGISASVLKRRFSYHRLFLVFLLLFTLALFCFSIFRQYWVVIALFVVNFVQGNLEPLLLGYIHHRTESHQRATVESLYNFVLRVLSIAIGLLFGYIASKTNIFQGFALLFGVALIYTFYFLPFHKKYINNARSG